MVVLAGIGIGTFALVRHHTPSGQALSGNTRTVAPPTTPPVTSADSPSPDAQPTVTPSTGTVDVMPDVAQDQDATQVADFVSQYFAAINARDYQAYISLFSMQGKPPLTQPQFNQGYRSTTDSSETLTGLSTADNGDVEADVTFTSHQDAAASVTGDQTCTDWTVSFFLLQNGAGYLIDKPPSSYHAAYAAC